MLHQRKFDKGMKTLRFYNTRDFVWKSDQLQNLPDELSEGDKKTFFCDYKTVRFAKIIYIECYYLVNKSKFFVAD